jgi:hypothetical protein
LLLREASRLQEVVMLRFDRHGRGVRAGDASSKVQALTRSLRFEPLEERALLAGTVVDHNDLAVVEALPDSALAAVAEQRWFFAHASVGANMDSGMADLRSRNATRYPLVTSTVSYNSTELRAANAPASTTAGRIYDCNRSNPGWSSKLTIFENSLNVSGWHDTAVDVVMNKFCYIDQAASADSYLNSMSTLEAAYPATRFVYMTMPLTTGEDANNVLRNTFNSTVRAYCVANGRLLFDLAEIEAYDPSGNAVTFSSGGSSYQKLYSGYTTDGGHLSDAGNVGRQRAALGWYAMAALIQGTLSTPTDVSLSITTLAENQSAGTTVGTLTTTDRDGGEFTYALVTGDGSNDNDRFTIVGNQLQTNELLDFETQATYQIRVRTSDSLGLHYEETFTISVADTNDAPTLDASARLSLTGIDEDDTASAGTLVATLLAGAGGTPIADADAGAVTGIAVTAVDCSHGAWQYTVDSGASWTNCDAVSTTAAVLLPSDTATSIRFLPDADWSGTLDAAITFVAWDQSSGTAGGRGDTTTCGGTTAFSVDAATASLTVVAVADSPVVAAPLADVTVAQDAARTTIDLSGVFSDVDAGDTLAYTVSPTTVAELVDEVTEANYTHILQNLLYTHTGDDRGYGTAHDLARNSIQGYFASLGLTTTLEGFTYNSTTYYNVVATKLGTTNPDEVYLVGAHFDSVNNPGADDNGSGTAAVMEIARVLAGYDFDATLRFVAFDREEQGLKGSAAYVSAHASDNILGMVDLDMIAYNPAGGTHDTVRLYDWVSGGTMKSRLATAVAAYATGISAVDAGQVWGSDHSSFETAGFDAAMIIESSYASNPYYHQSTDAVETAGYLDYAFATEITRAVTGYLASAAGLVDTTDLLTTHLSGSTLTLDYAAGQYGELDVTVRASDGLGVWVEDTFHVTVTLDASATLDTDGNGTADALTDGILMVRYLFDPAGDWSYADALGRDATRTTRDAIRSYLDDAAASVLDCDGNGTCDALTDGILILRYLFDPDGEWNYADAVASDATRTDRDAIRAFLDSYNPNRASSAMVADVGLTTVAPTACDATAETETIASAVALGSNATNAETSFASGVARWGRAALMTVPARRTADRAWATPLVSEEDAVAAEGERSMRYARRPAFQPIDTLLSDDGWPFDGAR